MNLYQRKKLISFKTYYLKEVERFFKVAAQTLFGPVVTTLLFLAVFALAIGDRVPLNSYDGIDFVQFLVPGLIMMTMMQNAFANSSSSFLMAKMNGTITDLLFAPLSPLSIVIGCALGAVTRGLLLGTLTLIAISLFVEIHVNNISLSIFFAVNACLVMSLMGMIGGVISEKIDKLASFTNFVITPLSFLSGTFYSIERLPEFWQNIAFLNPFFYMIDGFRQGFIAHGDTNIFIASIIIVFMNIFLLGTAYIMIYTGFRIKS